MAYLQMVYFSNSLMRRTQFTAILPMDHPAAEGWPSHEDRPYKTLYLLHGIFGDCMSWQAHSRIQKFAEERNLCVIMPSGENGFYLDHPDSYNNFSSMIKELVDVTRRMFPLSHQREDTFIGGFSMGGFGALANGIKYHETFGAICAFSSAILAEAYAAGVDFGPPLTPAYAHAMFGPKEKIMGSDADLLGAIDRILAEGREVPKIYLSCGLEDGLLGLNQDFAARVRAKGVQIQWETSAGGHDWDFWDAQIRHVLADWLDTEPTLSECQEKVIAH